MTDTLNSTGPSGTPHSQAAADAALNTPIKTGIAVSANQSIDTSSLGSTPEQLATLARWQAEGVSPKERIKTMMHDPGFRERLLGGDQAARQAWDQAHLEASAPAVDPSVSSDPVVQAQAAEIDQFFPAGKATEFDTSGAFTADHDAYAAANPNAESKLDPAAIAADQELRAWGEAARFPVPIFNGIVRRATESTARWQKMPETERVAHADRARSELVGTYGQDGAATKVGLARSLINAVAAKHPGIAKFMDKSGLTSDPYTISQLAAHAERLGARRGVTVEQIKQKLPKLFEI
jgi:hypothetical protein